MSATLNFGNVSISAGGGDFSTLPTWSQPGTTAAQGRTALSLGGATTAATAYDGDPIYVDLRNGGVYHIAIDGPTNYIVNSASIGVDSEENPGGSPTVFLPDEGLHNPDPVNPSRYIAENRWKVTIDNKTDVSVQVLRHGSTVIGYPEDPYWQTIDGNGNNCAIVAHTAVTFWFSPAIYESNSEQIY